MEIIDTNTDIEKNLAGILMQKPEVMAQVINIVSENDFINSIAREVFCLARNAFIEQKPFDLVIASTEIKDNAATLADMYDVIAMNYKDYAVRINEAGRQRRIVQGLKYLYSSPGNCADDTLAKISELHSSEIRNYDKSYSIADVAARVGDRITANKLSGKLPGFRTGFYFHDSNFVRYIPGHIWVVTGFTSVGKSKLLIEKAARVSQNTKVLIISTEMSEDQILARFYARETGINENMILSGQMLDNQEAQVENARKVMTNRNIKIVDDLYSLPDIEARVQQEAMTGGADVVLLDYVQNVDVPGEQYKNQGAVMAKRLQHLAKKANTCLICFSQVSNMVGRGEIDQFEAKGAGEWAAVADVGVRLKRSKEMELGLIYDMQKGRHYRKGTYGLEFSKDFTRLNDAPDMISDMKAQGRL